MNGTDTLHVIRSTRADHDFRFENTATDWYVLLWSQSQNSFHIERHRHMMDANRKAYAEDRCMDYVPLFVGTHDFCCRMADNLRKTLASRALERATPGRPNCPAFKDILNALDRQAEGLERQRDALGAAGDYGAMFPEADAQMLREAAGCLRKLQGER